MEISSKDIKFFPLGDAAVILQFKEIINHQTHQFILAISSFLDEFSFEGLIEYVPAYTSVTLFYDPLLITFTEIIANVEEMLERLSDAGSVLEPKVFVIPVCYGRNYGPDIDFVARHCKISVTELINMHTQVEYLVHMIGFAPGFPYLGGMDPNLETPRRESPRAMVAAGSVGIAGIQTGVYSISTPGGWQIIGRSPLKLFDLERVEPSLLKAGDKVRFKAISEVDFNLLANGN